MADGAVVSDGGGAVVLEEEFSLGVGVGGLGELDDLLCGVEGVLGVLGFRESVFRAFSIA